jgi:hypothetical protein
MYAVARQAIATQVPVHANGPVFLSNLKLVINQSANHANELADIQPRSSDRLSLKRRKRKPAAS